MPVYEYECTPCRTIYEVRQRLSDPPLETCPQCQGTVARIMSVSNVNRYNFTSPTAAKYARLSPQEEIRRERELQKDYQRIWLPPPVKHDPWEEH